MGCDGTCSFGKTLKRRSSGRKLKRRSFGRKRPQKLNASVKKRRSIRKRTIKRRRSVHFGPTNMSIAQMRSGEPPQQYIEHLENTYPDTRSNFYRNDP
jgi:hypothetical protein